MNLEDRTGRARIDSLSAGDMAQSQRGWRVSRAGLWRSWPARPGFRCRVPVLGSPCLTSSGCRSWSGLAEDVRAQLAVLVLTPLFVYVTLALAARYFLVFGVAFWVSAYLETTTGASRSLVAVTSARMAGGRQATK